MKSNYLFIYIIYLILAIPLFYFVYKYGDPEPLAHDFWQYYRLYYNLDIQNVIAPHNMRLAGAFFVHLLYKLNLFYDTETAFDKYEANWGFLKQVYFDALLFNFFCVVGTCVIIYDTIKRYVINSEVYSFTGGLLYLLGFGTIFYCLMPLTEAFSILLFAITYRLFLKRSYWIAVPLAIFIFQREYAFLALGLIATIHVLITPDSYREDAMEEHAVRSQGKYNLVILLICICCFTIYYILRKTIFYTPELDYQSTVAYMVQNLVHPTVQWASYTKQLFLTLNLFLLYLGIIVYKALKKLKIDKLGLLKLVALFLQVNILSIAGGHDNNAGRYFYLLIPIVIVEFTKEVLGCREHYKKFIRDGLVRG